MTETKVKSTRTASVPEPRPPHSLYPGTAVAMSRSQTLPGASLCSTFTHAPILRAAPRRRSTLRATRPPSPAPVAISWVSPRDPVAALDAFKTKHKLSIALASDEKHRMLEAYGVWQEKSMYGRKFFGIVRTTFLIGPDLRIVQVWPRVSVAAHAEAVLAAVKAM